MLDGEYVVQAKRMRTDHIVRHSVMDYAQDGGMLLHITGQVAGRGVQ